MSGKWSLLYRSIICFHYSPLTTSINCCKRYKESCISEFSLLKKLGSFANHAFLFIPVITPGGSTSLILQPPNQIEFRFIQLVPLSWCMHWQFGQLELYSFPSGSAGTWKWKGKTEWVYLSSNTIHVTISFDMMCCSF